MAVNNINASSTKTTYIKIYDVSASPQSFARSGGRDTSLPCKFRPLESDAHVQSSVKPFSWISFRIMGRRWKAAKMTAVVDPASPAIDFARAA